MPGLYYPEARATLGVVLESIECDDRPLYFPVRPHEISVIRNGYNEADTFSLTFNASHLPVSPEVIRAASVEIYLYNKRSLSDDPESIAKGEDSDLLLDGGNIRPAIVGLADDAALDFSEDGRYVSLSGRDYTSLYLDTDWNVRHRMTYKLRLDKAIQKLADDVPGSAGVMTVRVEMSELSAVRSNAGREVLLERLMPVIGKHEGRANKRGLVFPNKANFWEVMTSIAIRYGFIIFIKGTDIILTTPKSYIEGKTGSLAMAWGKNISDIHIKRKLGKERVPIIQCNSWIPKIQKTITGTWPEKGDTNESSSKCRRKSGENATALGTTREEIRQYTIAGVTSEKQLKEIARQAYNQLGRSEMTVQLATIDLEDLDGEQLLDVSSGDAIQVKFSPFNDDIHAERLEQELIARGYAKDVAKELAAKTDQMNELRSPLRIDSATIDYSIDSGIGISITARNFVNIFTSEENA